METETAFAKLRPWNTWIRQLRRHFDEIEFDVEHQCLACRQTRRVPLGYITEIEIYVRAPQPKLFVGYAVLPGRPIGRLRPLTIRGLRRLLRDLSREASGKCGRLELATLVNQMDRSGWQIDRAWEQMPPVGLEL